MQVARVVRVGVAAAHLRQLLLHAVEICAHAVDLRLERVALLGTLAAAEDEKAAPLAAETPRGCDRLVELLPLLHDRVFVTRDRVVVRAGGAAVHFGECGLEPLADRAGIGRRRLLGTLLRERLLILLRRGRRRGRDIRGRQGLCARRAHQRYENRHRQAVAPLKSHESCRQTRGFAAKTQNNVTE